MAKAGTRQRSAEASEDGLGAATGTDQGGTRALPLDDAEAEIDAPVGRPFAGSTDDIEDDARRALGHFVTRDGDGGQRRKGTGTEFEVVEADDRQLAGDGDAAPVTLEERAESKVVVAAEDGFEAGNALVKFGEELG